MDDAVDDLAGAINQPPATHRCPDRLVTGLRRDLRRDFDYAYLRFAEDEPRLPKRYSDVLIQEQSYYPCTRSEGQMTFYGGDVSQSPSGDVVVRWHKLNYWPQGWLKHPAPLKG